MPPRKLFVAGSTGATGRVLVPMARRAGLQVVPHARPATAAAGKAHPDSAVLDLADASALDAALRGCTTVLQLIGTMRKRFGTGDTYEVSDVGTTRLLWEAAKRTGVDHVILLGAWGTASIPGAYYDAKRQAEQLTRDCGIAWTTFRPSSLTGGEERRAPPGMKGFTRLLGLRGLEPISLEELSAALLQCAVDRAPLGAVVEGASLWDLVERGKAFRTP